MKFGAPFDIVDAEDYEALRPGYPAESAAWLADRAGLGPGAIVADVAAGTGKLTRILIGHANRVVAVEPSAPMRTTLARVVPRAEVVAAVAERLPFPTGALDAITVAHAFHHFDVSDALHEFRRVLRPTGVLALFWRRYDEQSLMKRTIGEIVDRYLDLTTGIPLAFLSWRETFDRTGLFEQVDGLRLPDQHVVPASRLVPLMATSSDIVSLPASKRRSLLGELGALVQRLPSTVELSDVAEVELFRPR